MPWQTAPSFAIIAVAMGAAGGLMHGVQKLFVGKVSRFSCYAFSTKRRNLRSSTYVIHHSQILIQIANSFLIYVNYIFIQNI